MGDELQVGEDNEMDAQPALYVDGFSSDEGDSVAEIDASL